MSRHLCWRRKEKAALRPSKLNISLCTELYMVVLMSRWYRGCRSPVVLVALGHPRNTANHDAVSGTTEAGEVRKGPGIQATRPGLVAPRHGRGRWPGVFLSGPASIFLLSAQLGEAGRPEEGKHRSNEWEKGRRDSSRARSRENTMTKREQKAPSPRHKMD